MKTNEQTITEIEAKIDVQKQRYISALTTVVNLVQNNNNPTLQQLLDLQREGTAYFNIAEQFVGNSDLLGGHKSGKWITGFAEKCYSILEVYINHIKTLRTHKDTLGKEAIEPQKYAYANMQRIVVQYMAKVDIENLRKNFEEQHLPIAGFKMRAARDKHNIPKWQTITSTTLGVLGIIAAITLTFIFPELTKQQWFVTRGLFSVSLAAFVPIVPGVNKMMIKAQTSGYFGLIATGTIVIFFFTWLINPPSL